jgi:hypothetical protein
MTGTTTAPDMDDTRTERAECGGDPENVRDDSGVAVDRVGVEERIHPGAVVMGITWVTAGEMRTRLTARLLKPHPALAKTESSVYRFKHKKRK